MDWLAIAARTAFHGNHSAASSALTPFFISPSTSYSASESMYLGTTCASIGPYSAAPAPPVQMYQSSGWGSSDPQAHSYNMPVVKYLSVPLYFISSHDPLYLFSLHPQQLYVAMAAHNLPSVSLNPAQCQEALLFHLASGTCVENARLGPASPSGCYHTGHSYDNTLGMAFHIVSLLLQHYIEALDWVTSRICSALGLDSDINFQLSLRSRCNEILMGYSSVSNIVDCVATLHALEKGALVALAANHNVSLAGKKSKDDYIRELMSHFSKGSCGDLSVGSIPVGCASAAAHVFDSVFDTTVPTRDGVTVTMMLMMSK
ncbi:hypothetical protein PM082_004541 [Marasmius tenuissimus]|nr:hypothetical protein PM082_004541 [Marasmius tenuissimus]